MGLLGKDWGVISLGNGCQTEYQIKRNSLLLSKLLGEDHFEPVSCPFDSWHTPLDALLKVLNLGHFPELLPSDFIIDYKPIWKDTGIVFWHSFSNSPTSDKEVSMSEMLSNFPLAMQKYRHKAENLSAIMRHSPNLIFVYSNEQRNIELHNKLTSGHIPVQIRTSQLLLLKEILGCLSNSKITLAVFTSMDRYIQDSQENGIIVVKGEIDQSGNPWQGRSEDWQAFWTEVCRLSK